MGFTFVTLFNTQIGKELNFCSMFLAGSLFWNHFMNKNLRLGIVAQSCNPSAREAEDNRAATVSRPAGPHRNTGEGQTGQGSGGGE